MLNTIQDRPDHDDMVEVSDPVGPAPQRSVTARAVRGLLQLVLLIAVLAGSYIAMNRLIAAKPERTARPSVDAALPVESVIAASADQRPIIRLFGQVAAARTVDLRPSVSGEVVSLGSNLTAGQKVEAGELLFEVDTFNFDMALAEANANLAQTRASIAEIEARIDAEAEQLTGAQDQLTFARDDLARAEQLRTNGTVTQKAIDDRLLLVSQREQAVSQRRNNLTIAQAQLAQQRAVEQRLLLGVTRAERDLENTRVTAPFSGIIRSTSVEIGRIVSANDVAVAMYDDTALDVRFTLTDAQYGRVAVDGDPLIDRQVELFWAVGGQEYRYEAIVSRIGADIASERGGVDVYARLQPVDQPVQIRPGAFVEVRVPDRLYPSTFRIPET
ncbi:MAG: HlyD family efflux transporter periplasmic adaptor subunit, partial [Ahrensia sp.]